MHFSAKRPSKDSSPLIIVKQFKEAVDGKEYSLEVKLVALGLINRAGLTWQDAYFTDGTGTIETRLWASKVGRMIVGKRYAIYIITM